MTDPTFYVQIADTGGNPTALYETRVAGSLGWAGYLATAPVPLPATIGITDSLNGTYGGAYVFCATRPPMLDTDPVGFIQQMTAYIDGSITANRAFFWLQSGVPPFFGPFDRYGFQFGQASNLQWTVNTNMNAALGSNLVFNVQASLIITADEANSRLVLGYPLTSNPLITLQTRQTTVVVAAPVSMQVPVAGTCTGCAIFSATLDTGTVFAAAPAGLAAGLQFAYASGSGTGTLFFPAFDVAGLPPDLPALVTIDPSDPVNTALTPAARRAGNLRSGFLLTGTPALPSCHVTPEGNAVTLTPVGASASDVTPAPQAGGLAFATSGPAGGAPGTAGLYLAPTGTYGVSTAGSTGATIGILGGLFGSESLTLPSHAPGSPPDGLLCFVPSEPAYAPLFPYRPANLQQTGSGALQPRLRPDYLTSWASVLAPAGVQALYRAEPEGSALYGVTSAGPASDVPILGSTPPVLPFTGTPLVPFPLIPYRRASTDTVPARTLTDFESQIILPTRRQAIAGQAATTMAARAAARTSAAGIVDADAAQYSTTPQGFLVTSDPASGAYLEVLLGQSDDGQGGFLPFSFSQPVSEQLETALQSNQLFLVAVNPTCLGTFESVANVAGWRFSAPVGQGVTPTSYGNVLILKFCSGSLLDRVKNPNLWTSAEDFSLAPGTPATSASIAYAGLAQWLLAYIGDAILKSQGTSPSARFYRNFAALAQDPDWTGVVVLKATLSVSDLPPEIAGLSAGINFAEFAAHHFGFTVSRVAADPTATPPLSMQGQSSFFGLIDYELPPYAQGLASGVDPDVPVAVPMTGDFQFTVLQLQALFENSKLADFGSRVQLSVSRLFGSSVVQAVSNAVPGVGDGMRMPATGVVLVGSYVAQSGDDSTAGSYVFQQSNLTVFQLDSNALQTVGFNRVQFNTLTDDGTTTVSRFIVWGSLDFVALSADDGTPFDILSFGSLPDTPPLRLGAGLAFSNLAITLSSPDATPNVQTFVVATGNINFDLATSSARPDSLFKGFGLQLKAFLSAGPDETPANHGFLPVSTTLDLVTLEPPWQGVVYRVTLGGPGALASAAGFDSDLLLAWSAAAKAKDAPNAVFVGLSLPGASPGAKMFSLQGVFKVSVGSISLIRQQVEGSTQSGFCLRLDDVGVKILGIAKLPPDATIRFFLFGDPNNTGSLGWYAAWVAPDGQTSTAKLRQDRSFPLLPAPGGRP